MLGESARASPGSITCFLCVLISFSRFGELEQKEFL